MSQTKTALKQIAQSEDYKALADATSKGDFATICKSYIAIAGVLEKAKKEIAEAMKNQPRKSKEAEFQQFMNAFDSRAKDTLPLWYQVDSELQSRKVKEGIVTGVGSKGDPMVKTKEGRLVILSGAKAPEGTIVRYRITGETEKVDFGRLFELTPESFTSILTEDAREQIRVSFNALNVSVDTAAGSAEAAELDKALKEMEGVKGLADKLQPSEKEAAIARVKMQRRRLLNQVSMPMMWNFISQEEEKEIKALYPGDEKKIAEALAAPGLFRRQSHDKAKDEMFAGDEVRGFTEVVNRKEGSIENMQSAMEALEFKAKIEEGIPKAKEYVARMARFYDGLTRRLNRLVPELIDANINETAQIISAIKSAFLADGLGAELRRAFDGVEEFSALRTAFAELRARFCDPNGLAEEAAFKPYLKQKIEQAFNARPQPAPLTPLK